MDFLSSLETETSCARARDRLEVAKRAVLGRRNNSSNVSNRVQQVPSVRSSVRSTQEHSPRRTKWRKAERRVERVREKIMPRGQGIIFFLEAMKNVTKSKRANEQQVPENREYRSFILFFLFFISFSPPRRGPSTLMAKILRQKGGEPSRTFSRGSIRFE